MAFPKKVSGFKIKSYPDGNVLVDIKRKQVSLVFLPATTQVDGKEFPDRYFAVSYNDDGYSVSATDVNAETAINECITKATFKIKEFKGIPVMKRNETDEYPSNVVVWWEKGSRSDSSMHYKCEYINKDNEALNSGVGNTLEEAMKDLAIWME